MQPLVFKVWGLGAVTLVIRSLSLGPDVCTYVFNKKPSEGNTHDTVACLWLSYVPHSSHGLMSCD